jgi:hypothetical protein
MPGRWNPIQHVNPANGQIEWPTGPIDDVDAGFSPRYVDAWVVQGGPATGGKVFVTGPSQSNRQSSGFVLPAGGSPGTPGKWEAKDNGWRQGQFQAGTASAPKFATGIALMALRKTAGGVNTYEYEWWFEVVTLLP